MAKGIKETIQKIKPKAKRFLNILLGVVFFAVLIGSAFKLSFLFGSAFIVAFALAIYNNELNVKPWKPIAVFVGALIIRIALEQIVSPILASEPILDLSVSALIFIAILVFAWRIKRS